MIEWITYPAILSYEEDGISVHFPDIEGCFTCGDTEHEAMKNAKEALGLHLYGMEVDQEELPAASSLKNIKLNKDKVAVLIEVYMPAFRENIGNKAVKKTLTIPKWLNDLGIEKEINFSQVLQEALKKHLGV